MKGLAILLMILPTSGVLAAAQASDTPNAQDIAQAHSEYVNEPCRQLIDQCDGALATPAAAIEGLDCRGQRDGSARCRFRVRSQSCKGRLFRGYGEEPQAWSARDFSRAPFRIRMRCR